MPYLETTVGRLRVGDVITEGWYELAGLVPATVLSILIAGDDATLTVHSASGETVTITQDVDLYVNRQYR